MGLMRLIYIATEIAVHGGSVVYTSSAVIVVKLLCLSIGYSRPTPDCYIPFVIIHMPPHPAASFLLTPTGRGGHGRPRRTAGSHRP